MVGIFENFDKLELEEMRFEVALFQAISISNYANEMKTMAQNTGTKIINTVSGLMNAKGIDEVRVETVEELVAEKCDELKYAVKEELHEEMVKVVKDRLVALGISEADLTDENVIAMYAIKEAENAIFGGVGQEASLAQKADDVASAFSKKQIKELKGNISQSRQDRDLLAHFVWKVSVHNDPYFPTGLEENENEASLDAEYRGIIRDKSDYQQKEKDINIAITNTEYKIAGAKANIVDLESKLGFVDIRVSEYEQKGEFDTADAASARRVKEITEAEIKTKREDVKLYETKMEALKSDKVALATEKEESAVKEQEVIAKISELVKAKWDNQLLGISVQADAVEHLVGIYSMKDRKVLEAALIELGSSSRPDLLAEGDNANGSEVFSFVLSERAIGRVIFKVENGTIVVSKILKLKK